MLYSCGIFMGLVKAKSTPTEKLRLIKKSHSLESGLKWTDSKKKRNSRQCRLRLCRCPAHLTLLKRIYPLL